MLVLLPLGVTLFQATQASFADAIALLFRPLVGKLLLNTLMLVVATTICSAVLGTAAAWLLERTRVPGRHVWSILIAVPLAIPAFITSYAWVSLSPALQDFAGALLIVTCSYYPILYLSVAAALRNIDPALEETARALGCGPWSCFLRVVLPHLRPALLGGMLVVALDVLVEFGAFSLLRFRTFTTEIYAEYRTGFNGPEASLLATVLVTLCILFLVAEIRVRGSAQYARLGTGTRRKPVPYELGWARIPVLAGFILVAIVALGVPLGMIAFWLTQHSAAAISPATASGALLISTAATSLEFSALATLLTLVLAFPLAFLAVRYRGWPITLLERTAYLAQGVPSIVVALALVALTVHALRPLYQSTALLIVAYAILFLPLALVSVRAALSQAQRGLEDAGRSLGLNGIAIAFRIIVPLAGPGLGAAAALIFVSVFSELTATLLLAPIGTTTLAIQVWSDTSTLAFAAAAPYAALMIGISLVSTWLLARRFGETAVFGASEGAAPQNAAAFRLDHAVETDIQRSRFDPSASRLKA
jgi:iron(III) transport system permease protein